MAGCKSSTPTGSDKATVSFKPPDGFQAHVNVNVHRRGQPHAGDEPLWSNHLVGFQEGNDPKIFHSTPDRRCFEPRMNLWRMPPHSGSPKGLSSAGICKPERAVCAHHGIAGAINVSSADGSELFANSEPCLPGGTSYPESNCGLTSTKGNGWFPPRRVVDPAAGS